MEIILLEKIQNLGMLGDTVKVANGYARNYLIPQKKALRATPEAQSEVEVRRQHLIQEEKQRIDVAQARADTTIREITLTRLTTDGSKLYGSISSADIVSVLNESGANIMKSEVMQPDGPIKQTGEFIAEIVLHKDVRFPIKIIVEAENPSESLVEKPIDDTDPTE